MPTQCLRFDNVRLTHQKLRLYVDDHVVTYLANKCLSEAQLEYDAYAAIGVSQLPLMVHANASVPIHYLDARNQ